MRVAFQGELGSFSEEAVLKFFGEVELIPERKLSQVFEDVERDIASFGMIPVENSQAGSINESYDLLLKYELFIYGELDLRVSHSLLALPGQRLEDIKRVYSHPQALAQCEEFLEKIGAEIIPTYDTAGSAKMIKEKKLFGAGAIASKRASEIYGLSVLAEGIESNPQNFTKFFAISKKRAPKGKENKTSIIFGTKNIPGALYRCLGAFAERRINLTKLESRPTKDKPWEYIFYLDFEGHIDDKPVKEALEDIKDKTTFLKILGSYPKFKS